MTPPPPHDPSERVLVAQSRRGAWEVRQFPASDARLAYLAGRGLLHLQLWHPARGVSILTPSRLTGGLYEVHLTELNERARSGSLDAIRAALRVQLAIDAPDDREIDRWRRWWVDRERRRAGRASATELQIA